MAKEMNPSGEINGNVDSDDEAFARHDKENEVLAASTVEIVTPPTVIISPTTRQCRREWFQRHRKHRQSPEYSRFEQIHRQQFPRSPIGSSGSEQSVIFLGTLDPEPDLWCADDEMDHTDFHQNEMINDLQSDSSDSSVVFIRAVGPPIDLVSTPSRNIGN